MKTRLKTYPTIGSDDIIISQLKGCDQVQLSLGLFLNRFNKYSICTYQLIDLALQNMEK